MILSILEYVFLAFLNHRQSLGTGDGVVHREQFQLRKGANLIGRA